jgi:anaerobic magnesium-protoporphyrin IX monomethyl ester cyclase
MTQLCPLAISLPTNPLGGRPSGRGVLNTKPKVLLIYPAIGLLGWGSRRNPVTAIGKGEINWISHGLALIGANCKKHEFNTELLDMRDLNSWEEFDSRLNELQPEVCGISISFVDYKISLEVIKHIRDILPLAKIVVGGFMPSLFPQYFDDVTIDHIIRGEGEVSFVELLEGKVKDRIIQGKRPLLDELPFADRQLFNYERETTCPFVPGQVYPTITMIAGRGCPYQCSYCQKAESRLYGKYRTRSPSNVIKELIELRDKYKFRASTWWDDTFTIDKDWVNEFCDLYITNGFTQQIVACCRADIICNNEMMIKRLAEIGVSWLVIGFETGTNKMLEFIKKGVTLEQNLRAAEICKKYGIKIFGTFMLGLPCEEKEDSVATINMIKKIKANISSIFYFTPIPATDIYDYCIDKELILREDHFAIERTAEYKPKIRHIDYNFLDKLKCEING